jgi:hypothetical protein
MNHICLLGAAAFAAAGSVFAATRYAVTDIGFYGTGWPSPKGVTVTEAGDVIATMSFGPAAADYRTGVYLASTGTLVDLGNIFPGSPTLSQQTMWSTANNLLDVWAGSAVNVTGGRTAYKTTIDHGLTWSAWSADIGVLVAGGKTTMIYAVNDRGVAVGWSNSPFFTQMPIVYSAAGGMRRLLAKPAPDTGYYAGMPYAINNAGDIVGEFYPGSYAHAFLLVGDTITDLTIGGDITAQAWDISDNGLIAFTSTRVLGQAQHAYLYDHGVTTDLGLINGTGCVPLAVNNAGVVVGDIQRIGYGGFIYANGVIRDMDNLIDPAWRIRTLGDINSAGVIAGVGHLNGSNIARVVRLTPVPDPLPVVLESIAAVPGQPAQMALTFGPRIDGLTYRVEVSPTLPAVIWQPLTLSTQFDNGTLRTVIDLDATPGQRFYRVQTALP